MTSMATRYCDTTSVVEALKQVRDDVDIGDNTVRVSVHNSEAVMRGIDFGTVRDRNLDGHLGEQVCVFEYDGTALTLSFHQSQIDGTFELNPAAPDAIAPAQQATSPMELAPAVGEVLRDISQEWEVIGYDFTEVSAGSIGNGHFTDFEFEYEVTSTQF